MSGATQGGLGLLAADSTACNSVPTNSPGSPPFPKDSCMLLLISDHIWMVLRSYSWLFLGITPGGTQETKSDAWDITPSEGRKASVLRVVLFLGFLLACFQFWLISLRFRTLEREWICFWKAHSMPLWSHPSPSCGVAFGFPLLWARVSKLCHRPVTIGF